MTETAPKPNVALFVSCPVDLMRPEVGFACVKLLEQAGCTVSVPAQSCCGQIAFNNGLGEQAKSLAWQIVQDFSYADYVVLPSGSCAGMMREHYPALFADDSRREQVQHFCAKVYEITCFLREVLDWTPSLPNIDLSDKRIAYHDSCAGLRELSIQQQPRDMLTRCSNAVVTEMEDTNVCCGFGGTFCVKFPDIAARMADDKLGNALDSKPDYLVGGDVSCLLHLAGRDQFQRSADEQRPAMQIRHVTELLAGELESAPLNASVSQQKPGSGG